MNSLSRRVPSIGLLALLFLLGACGSRPPKLEPPTLRLVDLTVTEDSRDATLRVRLTNPVPRALPVASLTLDVRIDGLELGRFEPGFQGELASLGSEVVTVHGPVAESLMDALAGLNEGRVSRLPLAIGGALTTESGDHFELEREGWLSPTPGRPWSFR